MSGYLDRIEALLDDLRSHPAVSIEVAEVEPAEFPLDEDAIEDVVSDGGFEPDDAMRAFWSEIDRVRLSWSVPALARPGSTAPGGSIRVRSIFDTCASGYPEDLVEQMVPDTDEERAHLLALRHLELGDALHWTAIRGDEDGSPRLWARFPDASGRRGVDVPLTLGFGDYVERLLSTCGSDGWPLLFLDMRAVPADARASLLRYQLPMIARGLDALEHVGRACADERRRLEHLQRQL
jgi:hypothetical protein